MPTKTALLICLFLLPIAAAIAQPFSPTLAAKLQFKIDSMNAAGNLRGISASVILPGTGTWSGISGISHAGNPIQSGMAFGIGSNTKLFTGVLLLKLSESKLIRLDDSIHRYLSPNPNIDPNITIRQLLNHSSGLSDVVDAPGYLDSILINPNRIYQPQELLKWIGPPLFPAGKGWNYSNTNYLLAGMVAEIATGKSYARLLRDSILSPLGLDSTFLDVYENNSIPVAHPWQGGKDNFTVPRISVNSAAWSAGGMYSTASELAQWVQALMSGRVLNDDSFVELTTFVGSGDYSIGLYRTMVRGRTIWQHGGSIWGGYNSSMIYDPATGAVICVLINQQPGKAFMVSSQILSVVTNFPLGVVENKVDEQIISVWPNPANDEVTLQHPDFPILNLKLFGPQGQLIATSTGDKMSVSGQPAGAYFIVVETDYGTFFSKLLIQ